MYQQKNCKDNQIPFNLAKNALKPIHPRLENMHQLPERFTPLQPLSVIDWRDAGGVSGEPAINPMMPTDVSLSEGCSSSFSSL